MKLNTIKKIFHYLLIPLITLSLFRPGFAKSRFNKEGQDDLGLEKQYEQAAAELASWFRMAPDFTTEFTPVNHPNLGYYFDNISFKDAYELNYSGNTGVIVSGSRSWNENPILRRQDLIIKLDDTIVKHRSHFEDIVENQNVGDTISVEYIRYDKTFQNKLPVFNEKFSWDDRRLFLNKPSKNSCGLGGASYKPMFLNADLSCLNDLFNNLGFGGLSNVNKIYHGFDLQGLIGSEYFIGGHGIWAGQKQSINYTISSSDQVSRNLKYNSGMGGISLDKRYRLSDRWIFSAGLMLGGGGTRFETDQIESSIDWNQVDTDTSGSYNDYLQLKKAYFLCQPRVSIMYRILPVFWLKIEAGYMLSYSKNGWQQILNDNKHDIAGPTDDKSLDGFTISISPWFGF